MIFALIVLVLIFAVTVFQATQGMFSALLMAILTICCAALSVGTHEWVAQHWVAPYLLPDYAYPMSLALVFGVPLSISYTLAQQLIRRAPLISPTVDKVGAGLCGLITGLVVTGMTAHALQTLPFDGSVIGYERIPLPSREKVEGKADPKPPSVATQSELWLQPDRFALGLGALMSAGVFSGDRLLAQDQPDLVTAAGWVSATNREVSRYAPANSLTVVRTEPVSFVYDFTPLQRVGRTEEPAKFEAKSPEAGLEFHMVRVRLANEARDARKSHTFTLRQFRLVGIDPRTDAPAQFIPIAFQQEDAAQPMNRHIRARVTRWGPWPVVDEVVQPRSDNGSEVEMVFELPLGFQPSFIEYKRGARAALSFSKEQTRPAGDRPGESAPPTSTTPAAESGATPPAETPPSGGSEGDSRRRRRGSTSEGGTGPTDRVRGVATREGQSFFSEDLPLTLKAYRSMKDLEVKQGRMEIGHVFGEVEAQAGGAEREIAKFAVPSDKRLLHLNTERLRARSGLGRALESAAQVAQNYTVEDENGNRYELVGKYALADVEGKRMVEVQYFPEVRGSIGGIGPFEQIKDKDLSGNYQLVLLFLVDPGVKITAFSTGGSASRREEFADENIVAPK